MIPTAIIHMFIRAERESDWLIQLHCLQQMRYGTWYLLERQGALSLPAAARHIFMNRIQRLRVPSATKVVSYTKYASLYCILILHILLLYTLNDFILEVSNQVVFSCSTSKTIHQMDRSGHISHDGILF